MEIIKEFSISYSPEFFRLCVVLLLILLLCDLEKLNKRSQEWLEFLEQKIDSLPERESEQENVSQSSSSSPDSSYRNEAKDLDGDFEREVNDEAPTVVKANL